MWVSCCDTIIGVKCWTWYSKTICSHLGACCCCKDNQYPVCLLLPAAFCLPFFFLLWTLSMAVLLLALTTLFAALWLILHVVYYVLWSVSFLLYFLLGFWMCFSMRCEPAEEKSFAIVLGDGLLLYREGYTRYDYKDTAVEGPVHVYIRSGRSDEDNLATI